MSTIAVNQITDTSGLLAPVFPPGSAQLNPMASREDKIINGDFSVWQRGANFTTAVYGADRWLNNFIGGAVTQSRQPLALGDNLGTVGLNPSFFLRQTVSGQTLASHFAVTLQKIESVRSYAGQTITVLGWARRSSGTTGNMVVEGIQNFGTGSPSPEVYFSPNTIALSTSWAPFVAVMNVPSVIDKTLGTANDWLGIQFFTSAGPDYASRANALGLQNIGVDLWGIHIRHGTWTAAATADYRQRDPSTELLLCQRYYETGDIGTDGGLGVKYGAAGAVTMFNSAGSYKVTKRVNPNVVVVGTPQYLNCSTLAFAGGPTSITTRVNVTALGLYRAWDCQWASDAEIN